MFNSENNGDGKIRPIFPERHTKRKIHSSPVPKSQKEARREYAKTGGSWKKFDSGNQMDCNRRAGFLSQDFNPGWLQQNRYQNHYLIFFLGKLRYFVMPPFQKIKRTMFGKSQI